MITLKKALTYEEQLERLKNYHHLHVDSDENAIRILKRVSYYRLSAYGIGLQEDYNHEIYIDGISLNHLYRLYCFDSIFKNIIFHAIECIEIQFRTQISNCFSLKYGAEGYMNIDCFDSSDSEYTNKTHAHIIESFKNECNRQKKLPFVKHHNEKYDGHFPMWVAVELFTFGNLVSLYSIMKYEDQKAISRLYRTTPDHLKSWLLAMVELRNLCAHYNRVYNMPLKQAPYLFKENSKYRSKGTQKVFPAIITIKKLLEDINPSEWNSTYLKFTALFEEYSDVVKLSFIGFPKEWKNVIQPKSY